MSRIVVLLCGPAGAGKTTAANQSGLTVYDRDDPQWPNERAFAAALVQLGRDPNAHAVVIRSGATASARQRTAGIIRATHVYVMLASPSELGHRIAHRRRADTRHGLASIKTWFVKFDRSDGVQDFPGWDEIGVSTSISREW